MQTFLTDVKVDLNPMRSPPPEIVNEGMQAMVRYMHARAHRVRMVLDKLDIFNFDFIQSHGRVGIGYVALATLDLMSMELLNSHRVFFAHFAFLIFGSVLCCLL